MLLGAPIKIILQKNIFAGDHSSHNSTTKLSGEVLGWDGIWESCPAPSCCFQSDKLLTKQAIQTAPKHLLHAIMYLEVFIPHKNPFNTLTSL